MGKFRILEWDSSFFGVKTARLDSDLKLNELLDVLEDLANNEVELIYFNATFEVPQNELYEAVLLDRRVALTLEPGETKPWRENIKIYDKDTLTGEMIELSRRLAKESKFFQDPNIPKEKVYEMYELWLEKSVQRIMATDTLVYEVDGRIVGLTTIKMENEEEASIPLLAVASDYEGKGISFQLLSAFEHYCKEANCKRIFSEARANNKKAVTTYKRYGIGLSETQNIYHLWKKK